MRFNFSQDEDMKSYFEAAGGGNDSLLIEYLDRPGFDVDSVDSDGDTALYWAACRQRVSTAQILLDRGANPNVVGANGSPLRMAAGLGNFEIAGMLLDKGATIDSDLRMGTPLNMAIKQRQFNMAEYLLSRGANPNRASGNMDETPLMGAAMLGNPDLVRSLIRYGADVNQEDVDGDTPIVYLTIGRSMNTQIAKELLLNGASIDDLYSHGHVFVGGFGAYRRRDVTRAVLYDDDVFLAMANPGSSFYCDLCY